MTDAKKNPIFNFNVVFPEVRCQGSYKTPLFCQNKMVDVFGLKYLKLINSAMIFDIWKRKRSIPSLKNSNSLHKDLLINRNH